eukprot:2072815-Pyramimonas_sp.AAC.1
MRAALEGKEPGVKLLLAAGCEADAKDNSGRRALSWAAEGKDEHDSAFNTATSLLEAGAEVDAKDEKGDTALMTAAANGNDGAVRALLFKSAKLTLANNDGLTALMRAAEGGHVGAAGLLIDVKTADIGYKFKPLVAPEVPDFMKM